MLIKNGTVYTPEGLKKADIRAEGGVIREIAENLRGGEFFDASGCLVLPGFIDAHTHFQMDNGTVVTADDFASGTRAAIAGGTTTILDFATQRRGGTLREALDEWHKRSNGVCSCDYGFHMAVSDWNAATRAELAEMLEKGVSSFKAYMAYDALRLTDDSLYELIAEVKKLGGIVGVHCELGDEVSIGVAARLAAGETAPMYHPLTRPPEVEAGAIEKLAALAKRADAPVHIVHLSSLMGLTAARKAIESGARLIIEACPQYLTLSGGHYAGAVLDAAKYVCSPPLRAAEDIAALWQAAADGGIYTISSDHCGYTAAQKALGKDDFSKIPNGLPSVEYRASLIWSIGVNGGIISAEGFARLMSENAARLFGLYPKKGALAAGSDADIVVWDPAREHTLAAKTQNMAADYCAWEGFEAKGLARAVFLRGRLAAENGRPTGAPGGQYAARGRSIIPHIGQKC